MKVVGGVILLVCLGAAHGFSTPPALRHSTIQGVASRPLRSLAGAEEAVPRRRPARGALLRMQEGEDAGKKDAILKKLGGIDNERASPPKEEKTMEGPFPDWAYVAFPVLGAATAFLLQYVGKAPQL
eukprot:CAMPEP_0173439598 /NCGR_PEP_ID=MMETSP1357-20121228/21203_1 /TAXON_ID=77926 /ORGANISM="Hemiselmis rufescens, Strain PCC563" /LENGTH=126 /DNA_ID=CAMNT_0014404987 /DNA_START=51 /DNA_END=431 /DNA_ORIENTATION=-